MTTEELLLPLAEDWALIPGWPKYEVSTTGKVRNAQTKRERRPYLDPEGYAKVTLFADVRRPPVRVHRLVALAWLGDPPEGMTQVNHIDGNRANNCAWNLEWCGPKENVNHSMHALGRRRKIAEGRRANGRFGPIRKEKS